MFKIIGSFSYNEEAGLLLFNKTQRLLILIEIYHLQLDFPTVSG
jgi:hypothetical protein